MGIGKDSYWQVAEETTAGTFAPATRKSEMISEATIIDLDEIIDPSLFSARSPRATYQGARRMRGTLDFRMNYEGAQMKFLKAVLGSGSSALVTLASGGPADETIVRNHTMKEGATIPSLSLEISKGDIPTGKILRASGVLLSKLTLSGGVGTEAMCRGQAEFLGIDLDPNTGTTPAGYTPTTTIAGPTATGGTVGQFVITTAGDFIASGFAVGMPVSGTNVGAGAIIVSITSATSLTVSVANTGTVSGVITATLAFPAVLPIMSTQGVVVDNGIDAWGYCGLAGSSISVANANGGTVGQFVLTISSGNFIASGVRPGMPVTGTNVGTGAVVVSVDSVTQVTVSVANAGTVSGTLVFTNGTGRVRHWQVTIENTLAERLYVGSVQPDNPLLNDRLKITWEFQEEFQTLKAYQTARQYTITSPQLIFQDTTTIGTSSKREFELRSNVCRCKYENPVEGYGIVIGKSTHTAAYDSVDASALVARFRSLDGSI